MSLARLLSETVGLWRNQPATVILTPKSDFPDVSDAPPDTRRMIRDRRYCRVLTDTDEMNFDDVSRDFAWKALEFEMALVPGGEVTLISDTAVTTREGFELLADYEELVSVKSFYMDRHCITNAGFSRFVQAGGYTDPQYWPEHVLPNLLQFVDRTGNVGPKLWHNSQPPEGKENHPVVGICWYEANAYATWTGKCLPSTEQWQRSATWPKGHGGNGAEIRYPWGNAFDPSKTNVWASAVGDTVPCDQYARGGTPNGVKQLIGNVWEWVDTQFLPTAEEGISVLLEQTMAEIRGAAFDTYFPSQANCQFRSGQPLLHRAANIGFRCCISTGAMPGNIGAEPQSTNDPQATEDS